MYLYNGTLPKRATGDLKFWAGVIPGDTSATLWTDVHTYDELPKVIDPPSGWVQNTNDPPWSATYPRTLDPKKFPAYFPGTDFTFRTARSLQMLNDDAHMTFDGLAEHKYSTHVTLTDRILDDLLAAVAAHGTDLAKKAAAVLAAWDRAAESDSRGTLLFEAFALKFMGPALASRQGFAVAQDATQPFTTPRGLKDPAAAAQLLDAAAQDVLAKYGALDAPYGEFRRLQIGKVDLPGNGITGSLGSFRVIRYAPAAKGDAKQRAIFGDSFLAMVEFGPDGARARVLTSYGASTQPGSPHAADQLKLLSEKKFRPALRTRAEVEANLESRDLL
jgi:acyl-homoserine-lactone acylase